MKKNDDVEYFDDPALTEVRLDRQLSVLFGEQTVAQARLIDATDLDLNDEMTACITNGLTRLKQLRGDPAAQRDMVNKMTEGERLLLCMWIMDMNLLDKVQNSSYT